MPDPKPHNVFLKIEAEGKYVQIDHVFESYEAADTFCDQLIDVFDRAGIVGFDVYEKAVGEDD